MKRSICASGNGYVPSDSIGFCVAMTRNGSGRRCVSRPIVTCRSCIASSSADCTFAGARLISSARTRFANTGPRLAENDPSRGLNTSVPVRSAGSRSGVNWMRLNDRESEAARVRTASVLASPGTPSSRRWPSASRPMSRRWTITSCPTMTRPISARMACIRSPARVTRSVALPASMLMGPPPSPPWNRSLARGAGAGEGSSAPSRGEASSERSGAVRPRLRVPAVGSGRSFLPPHDVPGSTAFLGGLAFEQFREDPADGDGGVHRAGEGDEDDDADGGVEPQAALDVARGEAAHQAEPARGVERKEQQAAGAGEEDAAEAAGVARGFLHAGLEGAVVGDDVAAQLLAPPVRVRGGDAARGRGLVEAPAHRGEPGTALGRLDGVVERAGQGDELGARHPVLAPRALDALDRVVEADQAVPVVAHVEA